MGRYPIFEVYSGCELPIGWGSETYSFGEYKKKRECVTR